jgi:hypothetical protein
MSLLQNETFAMVSSVGTVNSNDIRRGGIGDSNEVFRIWIDGNKRSARLFCSVVSDDLTTTAFYYHAL